MPSPVGHRSLRLAAKGERAGYLTLGSVDRRHALASAVECKHSLCNLVVKNGVRILFGLYRGQWFERFQVEHGDSIRTTVARESSSKVCGHGNAVNPGRVCHLSL